MTNALTGAARFFQEGGAFMLPIAVVLAIGVAIALERWLYLLRARLADRRHLRAMLELLSHGKLKELHRYASASDSAAQRIFRAGLERLPGTRRRQDVEYALEESLLEEIPAIEKRTPYLATFANMATLLGLLGTIIGLIAAFTAVADADPAEKARLLSSSISIAMNTTAFGLMVAIPLLFVHAVLQGMAQAHVERLEVAVVRFLNLLEARHQWAPDGQRRTPIPPADDVTAPRSAARSGATTQAA